MSVRTREEAFEHYGHDVVLAAYFDRSGHMARPISVTIECNVCGEVLVAFEDLEHQNMVLDALKEED